MIAGDESRIISYVDWGEGFKPITLADVRRNRREIQELILRRRLEVRNAPRAWRLWVAYYDQPLMGGWQVMMDRQGESIWIDRDRKWLHEPLMRLFPFDTLEWRVWKMRFAERYERRQQDGRPLGVALVWFDGHAVRTLPPCPK